MKIRSEAKDSSCPDAEKKGDFLHRHWGQVLHRWTAPSDTNPCGNAPFGTALRHSTRGAAPLDRTVGHEPLRERTLRHSPSAQPHQPSVIIMASVISIHTYTHPPAIHIYIYLSWVIVGLAGECVKVALRVL
jgi:hypothetical protein